MRFRLRKDSVSDLIRILDRDLQKMNARELLAIYLVPTVSVFAACTVIHKVSSAIATQEGFFLSFQENVADTNRKFIDVAHISTLHFSLFMTLSSFHDHVSPGPFSTGVSAASSILEAHCGRA